MKTNPIPIDTRLRQEIINEYRRGNDSGIIAYRHRLPEIRVISVIIDYILSADEKERNDE